MPKKPADIIENFYYKNNRLQQLRGFCYAAQLNNISKAAKHLGLTHSSVSLQIKTLERDLGIKLFDRNGPRLSLTKEGEKLLKLALPHIDGIDNIREEFKKELTEQKRTEFHISANSTTLNFILPEIMPKYLKEYPDIYTSVYYAEFHEAIQKLKSGEVEIAMLPQREHLPFPKEFEYIPVFHYQPALITRHDHPLAGRKHLTIEEICKYELTLPAEDLRVIPDLYEIFPRNNINKKLRINFINWETTRKYIEAGSVISISSDVIISDRNDALVATSLAHLFKKPVSYGFVIKKSKKIPQKILDMINISRAIHKERNLKKVYGN